MLSNSSKYALKAVLYLGLHSSSGTKVLAKDLSRPINVPQAYLSKLLQQLSRHHIVSSSKGPGGGFFLTDENRRVPLIKIIEVIDGDRRLTSCMLSLDKCDANRPCPMHHLLGNARIHFIQNLGETSVEELVLDVSQGRSFLPL